MSREENHSNEEYKTPVFGRKIHDDLAELNLESDKIKRLQTCETNRRETGSPDILIKSNNF